MNSTTTSERPIAYYSCNPNAETLRHETVDAAVEEHLDDLALDIWPSTLPVYGWRRMRYDFDAEQILAMALETADEEHGSPDESTEPTPAMIAAAEAFAEVLDRDYVVWACERDDAPIVTVNVADWVLTNQRAWCDDPAVAEWIDSRRSGRNGPDQQ